MSQMLVTRTEKAIFKDLKLYDTIGISMTCYIYDTV